MYTLPYVSKMIAVRCLAKECVDAYALMTASQVEAHKIHDFVRVPSN